ncbi:MAG: hypothetical protein ACXQT4_03255, partial [Methanotrichaceae archaeon]
MSSIFVREVLPKLVKTDKYYRKAGRRPSSRLCRERLSSFRRKASSFREGDECFVPPKVVQIYNSEGVVDRTYRYLYIVWVTN